MGNYRIDLTDVPPKKIYQLSSDYKGKSPKGEGLSFTSYYMEINGEPYFGISGEIHYSRLWEERWKTRFLK